MKGILCWIALLGCAAMTPTTVIVSELFDVVGQATEKRAAALNRDFILKATYFATQYQLVRVEPSLLDRSGDIVLPAFDDQPIELKHLSTRTGDGHTFWKGRVASVMDLTEIADAATGEALPEISANEVKQSMAAVSILVTDVHVSESDGHVELKPVWLKPGELARSDQLDLSADVTPYRRLRTIDASIQNAATGKKYTLRPLPNTPEVHLWMESDRTKRAVSMDHLTRQDDIEEQSRRSAAYDAYLKKHNLSRTEKPSLEESLDAMVAWLKQRNVNSVSGDRQSILRQQLREVGYDPDDLRKAKADRYNGVANELIEIGDSLSVGDVSWF